MLYLIFLLTITARSVTAELIKPQIGICYGTQGNNLPAPEKSVRFILQNLKAKQVKIYNVNAEILNAVKGTDLQVTVTVPNELIINISSDQTLADQWIQTNIVPFYPEAIIRFILVGKNYYNNNNNNNFRQPPSPPPWFYHVVPAIRKIRSALKRFGLNKNVKVGTPLVAMDVLEGSNNNKNKNSIFPPSNARFRSDITGKVMKPLLQFLSHTKSFLFLDLFPYFEWTSKPDVISLEYALLQSAFRNASYSYRDSGSGLVYTNLIDQMLDSVVFAMKKLGYPNIRLYIAETGWPNGGDVDQIGANVYNAATYNRNIVKKFTAKPPLCGTPARPGEVIPINILALYNENRKPGPSTERHFGLLYTNGSYIYDIDLSGETPDSAYGTLPLPMNNEPYKGKAWCVIAKGANFSQLAGAIESLCTENNSNSNKHLCRAIQPGRKCYRPDSLILHASYVFSSYWAHFRKNGTACFFNGLAVQTKKDPSYLSCKFPSVTL